MRLIFMPQRLAASRLSRQRRSYKAKNAHLRGGFLMGILGSRGGSGAGTSKLGAMWDSLRLPWIRLVGVQAGPRARSAVSATARMR
jgi:hypothetical protein